MVKIKKLSGSITDVLQAQKLSKKIIEDFSRNRLYEENKSTIHKDLPRTSLVDFSGNTHADFCKEVKKEAIYDQHYLQGNLDGGLIEDLFDRYKNNELSKLLDANNKKKTQEFLNDWYAKDESIQTLRFAYRDDNECDLLLMSLEPSINHLSTLPITDAAYIRYNDQLFYVSKKEKKCEPLKNVTSKMLKEFDSKMKTNTLINDEPKRLSDRELKSITSITGHTHDNSILCACGFAFNKKHPQNWALQIINDTIAPLDKRTTTLFARGKIINQDVKDEINSKELPEAISKALNSKKLSQIISKLIDTEGNISVSTYEAFKARIRINHNIDHRDEKQVQLKELFTIANNSLPNNNRVKNLILKIQDEIDHNIDFFKTDEFNNTINKFFEAVKSEINHRNEDSETAVRLIKNNVLTLNAICLELASFRAASECRNEESVQFIEQAKLMRTLRDRKEATIEEGLINKIELDANKIIKEWCESSIKLHKIEREKKNISDVYTANVKKLTERKNIASMPLAQNLLERNRRNFTFGIISAVGTVALFFLAPPLVLIPAILTGLSIAKLIRDEKKYSDDKKVLEKLVNEDAMLDGDFARCMDNHDQKVKECNQQIELTKNKTTTAVLFDQLKGINIINGFNTKAANESNINVQVNLNNNIQQANTATSDVNVLRASQATLDDNIERVRLITPKNDRVKTLVK